MRGKIRVNSTELSRQSAPLLLWRTPQWMPNVPISCLPPSQPYGPRSSRTVGHHRLSSAR